MSSFLSYAVAILGLFGLIATSGMACVHPPAKQADISTYDSLPIEDFLFSQPAAFAQCHASTLIHLESGQFIAAWFGGTKEKADDVGIWITKGRPGHWETPVEVAKLQEVPHWNPVLFQAPSGKIFLFFKTGKEIAQWSTWVKTSTDQGNTWSDAYELAPGDKGGRGPVRNKPIVLSNGDWLAGASNENGPWNVFFDRSTDEGKTWEATPYIAVDHALFKGKGIIQPTLWEHPKGVVHALLRSSEGYIYRTDSKDYGKTWSAAYQTPLKNPNSAIDMIQLSSDTLLLVCNTDNHNWGSRGTLILAISYDNGQTWPEKIPLVSGKKDEEYSYPAIIRFKDTVALTYTWKRQKIAFWLATKEWILSHSQPF